MCPPLPETNLPAHVHRLGGLRQIARPGPGSGRLAARRSERGPPRPRAHRTNRTFVQRQRVTDGDAVQRNVLRGWLGQPSSINIRAVVNAAQMGRANDPGGLTPAPGSGKTPNVRCSSPAHGPFERQ
jgi:hypothetical protein